MDYWHREFTEYYTKTELKALLWSLANRTTPFLFHFLLFGNSLLSKEVQLFLNFKAKILRNVKNVFLLQLKIFRTFNLSLRE